MNVCNRNTLNAELACFALVGIVDNPCQFGSYIFFSFLPVATEREARESIQNHMELVVFVEIFY
jgi:hypothetical protein